MTRPPLPDSKTLGTPPARGFGRAFESLAVPDFRWLWLGNIAATFAMQMQQIARGWLIYDMTGSALQLTWVMMSFSVPMAFLSLFGGVVADRYPKRRILLLAQSLNGMSTFALGLVILADAVTLWHFIFFGLFNGTLFAFSMPARQSLIPDLVGERRLVNAVALGSTSMNLSRVLGPSLAGAVIAIVAAGDTGSRLGVGVVFMLNTAMYGFAAVSLRGVRNPGLPGAPSGLSPLGDIAAGIRYMTRTPVLRGLLLLTIAPLLLGMPIQSLMPVFNAEIVDGGPAGLGMLMAAMGAGAITGSMALARFAHLGDRGSTLFVLAIAWSLCLVGFAASRSLPIAVVWSVLIGLTSASYLAVNNSMLQLTATPAMRGRVMSIVMLSWGLMPFSAMPLSIIAERWGIDVALGLSGLLLLGLSALAWWQLPEIRRLPAAPVSPAAATTPEPPT